MNAIDPFQQRCRNRPLSWSANDEFEICVKARLNRYLDRTQEIKACR